MMRRRFGRGCGGGGREPEGESGRSGVGRPIGGLEAAWSGSSGGGRGVPKVDGSARKAAVHLPGLRPPRRLPHRLENFEMSSDDNHLNLPAEDEVFVLEPVGMERGVAARLQLDDPQAVGRGAVSGVDDPPDGGAPGARIGHRLPLARGEGRRTSGVELAHRLPPGERDSPSFYSMRRPRRSARWARIAACTASMGWEASITTHRAGSAAARAR